MRLGIWMCWMAALLLVPAAALGSGDPIEAAAARIATEAGDSRIVVIGELHGTREAPAVAAALARRFADQGPLLIGLEVSRAEHAAISAFLDSDGGNDARQAMRSGEFWDVPPERNDGRRTEDMLDLIAAVRQLRSLGRDVAIVPFDIGPGGWVDSTTRDRDMADYLRTAFLALPQGRMLVLTGNVHAMRQPPPMIDDGVYRTATQLLADLDPFAVHLSAPSGDFWGCVNRSCGVRGINVPGTSTGPVSGSFHFQYALPRYTVGRLVGAPH